jgi:HAD superfamily hydrolase (TIGR01509 family)
LIWTAPLSTARGHNRAAVQDAAGERYPIDWSHNAGQKESLIHAWLKATYHHFDRPADAFLAACQEGYKSRINQLLPREGMLNAFQAIQEKGLPILIVTNTLHDEAVAKLRATGLLDHVMGVIGSDTVEKVGGLPKPSPDPYILAARQLGLEPHSIVGFEDSPPGMTSLVKAGFRSVHIRDYGDPANPLADFHVDGQEPEQLITTVNALLGDESARKRVELFLVPQPGSPAHP